MKWDGVMLNKRGKKRDHLAEAKRMAQVAGLCVLPDVKMPRKPRKDRGVLRGKNRRVEDALSKDVIKYLRKVCGIRNVKKIENSVTGKHLGNSLPDILCFYSFSIWWIELKSDVGILSDGQRYIRAKIEESGGRYVLARSVDDLKQAGVI